MRVVMATLRSMASVCYSNGMTHTSPAAPFAAEFVAARRRAARTDITTDQRYRAIRKAMRVDDRARAAGIVLDVLALDELAAAA